MMQFHDNLVSEKEQCCTELVIGNCALIAHHRLLLGQTRPYGRFELSVKRIEPGISL